MSSRLYELKARIKADASVALEVRDLYTVNGKEFEGDPRPIADGDADTVAFLAGFNSAAVAERDAKIAELAQAKADHQAALAAKDAAHAEAVATLNADHAAAVEVLNTERQEALQAKDEEIAALNTAHAEALAAKAEEIAELQSDLATANTDKVAAEFAKDTAEAALATAQARIEELEAELDALKNPPVVPSILDPADFLERFTDAELDTIQTANNPVARKAERALFTRKSVDLTSPLLAELMAALVAVELLTAERAAAIMEIGE